MELTTSGDFLEFMTSNMEKGSVPKEDSIIDKNVLRGDDPILSKDKRPSPILKSYEKMRYTAIFKLFSKVFFDYKKKEVDGEGTFISEMKKKVAPPETETEKKGGFGSFLQMLMGGVLLVAAAIPTLIAAMFQKMGPLADTLKALGKGGLLAGLALLKSSFLKFFGTGTAALKFLKPFPIIGAIVNFYFAYQHFKNGEWVKGIYELVSGLANFIPVIGPFLSAGMDIAMIFLDKNGVFDEGGMLSKENAWSTIKGWASVIGNTIWEHALWLPVLGGIKRMGMAWDHFQSGNYGEGIKEVVKGILSFTNLAPLVTGYEVLAGFLSGKLSEEPKELNENSSWSDRMIEWIREKLNVLPWWVKKPLSWMGLIPDSMVEQDVKDPGLDDKKTNWFTNIKNWIKEKIALLPGAIKLALSFFGIGEGDDDHINMSDVEGAAKKGFEDTKNFVKDTWDKVKGPIGDGVTSIKNFAVDTWEKTKEFSENAWNSIKENAPKVWDSMKEFSGKVKDKLAEWIPKTVDIIDNAVDSSLEALKKIVTRIGTWLSAIFGGDSTGDMKNLAGSSSDNLQRVATQSSTLVTQSSTHTTYLKMLVDFDKKKIELLSTLVRIEERVLNKLSNIGGGRSNASHVNMDVPSFEQSSPMVPLYDNRNGFASSAYSLG